jgi:hypothetical protein
MANAIAPILIIGVLPFVSRTEGFLASARGAFARDDECVREHFFIGLADKMTKALYE